MALWASLVGCILAAVLAIAGLLNKGAFSRPLLWVAVVLVALVALLNIIERVASHYQQKNTERAAATSGHLAGKTRIRRGPKGPYIRVQVGRAPTFIDCLIGEPGPNNVIHVLSSILSLADLGLKMREDPQGRLLASITLRDSAGNIIARIQDNEWQVNPNNHFDRNYSDNAFEVIDQRGQVVLQLCMLPDRVQLQARFFNADGKELILCEAPPGSIGHVVIGVGGEHAWGPQVHIRPLFRYPSNSHLGERSDCACP
jgi:hypothetical protein